MKKKLMVTLLTSLLIVETFSGCGITIQTTGDSSANNQTVTQETAPSQNENSSISERQQKLATDSGNSAAEVNSNSNDVNNSNALSAANDNPLTENSGSEDSGVVEDTASRNIVINDNDMKFYIYGKQYTLGKSTLQDLINDGVTFTNGNGSESVDSNSQSIGYKIELADSWTALVSVLNSTGSAKSANQLVINEVYLPVNADKTQSTLSFDFPLNMTENDLRTAAGEPTDFKEYSDSNYTKHTLKYTHEPATYYGDCGYTFEFTNGELRYVTLEYLP